MHINTQVATESQYTAKNDFKFSSFHGVNLEMTAGTILYSRHEKQMFSQMLASLRKTSTIPLVYF